MKRAMPLWLGLALLGLFGCDQQTAKLEMALESTLRNYVVAVRSRDEAALQAAVLLPEVPNYTKFVNDTLLRYLEQVQTTQRVTFDVQGIVLTRFLGLDHHRHQVLETELMNDLEARMRVSVSFAYDNNISLSNYEKGTKVFVPGKPWGSVHILEVGGEIPVPREQLKYLELDVFFNRSAPDTGWLVQRMTVDRDKLGFEFSLKDSF